MSRILPTLLVFISGYANTENVFYCLNVDFHDFRIIFRIFRITFRKKFRTKEDNQEVQVNNGIPHLIHHQAPNTKRVVKKAIYLKNYTPQISDKYT